MKTNVAWGSVISAQQIRPKGIELLHVCVLGAEHGGAHLKSLRVVPRIWSRRCWRSSSVMCSTWRMNAV